MPAASSRSSRKRNNEGEGNVSSPFSARVSGSKKKKVDSPAALKRTAVITSTAAAPAPAVAPAPVPAPAPVVAAAPVPAPIVAPAPFPAPVVEPAEKKKADISAEALNVAGAPVHSEHDSLDSQGSSVVTSDQESEEEEEGEEEEEPEVEEEKEVAVRLVLLMSK